ncbi:hypothetical protein lerEdw1_010414 [Lerista edwardsae]|nr:hypothetical protein lerEdw1_010414 [Lerista edwardsae]
MASSSRRLQTKPVITCLKSVLLIYTFVFWFSGIILLAVGIWGKVSLEVYFSLLNENATNVPYVLIGTGAVVVLLGTFGCFATCRGSTWMLKLYAMFLTLTFLVVLVAAIVGFVFRHEIKDSFRINYKAAVNDYSEAATERNKAVDTIQSTHLKCRSLPRVCAVALLRGSELHRLEGQQALPPERHSQELLQVDQLYRGRSEGFGQSQGQSLRKWLFQPGDQDDGIRNEHRCRDLLRNCVLPGPDIHIISVQLTHEVHAEKNEPRNLALARANRV